MGNNDKNAAQLKQLITFVRDNLSHFPEDSRSKIEEQINEQETLLSINEPINEFEQQLRAEVEDIQSIIGKSNISNAEYTKLNKIIAEVANRPMQPTTEFVYSCKKRDLLVPFFEKHLDKMDKDAAFAVATFYRENRNEINLKKYIAHAAEKGHYSAIYDCARYINEGQRGFEKNPEKAKQMLSELMAHGDDDNIHKASNYMRIKNIVLDSNTKRVEEESPAVPVEDIAPDLSTQIDEEKLQKFDQLLDIFLEKVNYLEKKDGAAYKEALDILMGLRTSLDKYYEKKTISTQEFIDQCDTYLKKPTDNISHFRGHLRLIENIINGFRKLLGQELKVTDSMKKFNDIKSSFQEMKSDFTNNDLNDATTSPNKGPQ